MNIDEVALAPGLRPPMANGEVIFDAPWQGRVFGIAVALCEAGRFTWPEFQSHLIRVVGAWDADGNHDEPYRYYELFARALADLLESKGIVAGRRLDERVAVLAARPHDHDHHHRSD